MNTARLHSNKLNAFSKRLKSPSIQQFKNGWVKPLLIRGRQQAGFTLIELLVVIGILSVMATIALNDVTGTVEQQNFDQTVYKMKNIRRAILGSDKIVNGEPLLEGFVADMGRLPNNLAELLSPNNCKDPRYDTRLSCEDNGKEWIEMPGFGYHLCVDGATPHYEFTDKASCEADSKQWKDDAGTPKIQWGWRGPYINVFADLKGKRTYHDGWGNKYKVDTDGDGEINPDENFGWVFDSKDVDADGLNDFIELRSKGQNNFNDDFDAAFDSGRGEYEQAKSGEDGLTVYEKPYPPHYNSYRGLLVKQHDFQTIIPSTVSVNLGTAPQCWKCSVGADNNYGDCVVNNGNKWKPLDHKVEADCVAASAIWQPIDKLCLKIYSLNNGVIKTIVSTLSSDHKWDDSSKVNFDIDGKLTLGHHKYGVYFYDDKSVTNICSDDLVFDKSPDVSFGTFSRNRFPLLLDWEQN